MQLDVDVLNRGCRGATSAIVAAIPLTTIVSLVGLLSNGGAELSIPQIVIGLALTALVGAAMSAIGAFAFGVPAYLLAVRFDLPRLPSLAAFGAVAGAAVLSLWTDGESAVEYLRFALYGIYCSVAFWWIAERRRPKEPS